MDRQTLLTKMRELEALGEPTPEQYTELEYCRAMLYPLKPSEMADWELNQYYAGEFDEPDPKFAMRMSGKGTRRVHHVLSGRAIY